mmetsp:Transcript_48228/g.134924  ORF Transcript_48228/g.134924 Transcript_48228/m.134924 type:complete len:244 (+) Transcript_48228:212-943(+)
MGLYRKLGPGPQGRCTTSTFPGPTGLLGGIKRSKRVGGWRWAAPPRAQLVPNPKPPPPVDNLTHVDGAAVGPRFPVVVVAVALRVVGVPALVHRVREASGLNVVSVSSLEGSLVTLGSGGENGLLLDSVNLLLLLVLGAVVRGGRHGHRGGVRGPEPQAQGHCAGRGAHPRALRFCDQHLGHPYPRHRQGLQTARERDRHALLLARAQHEAPRDHQARGHRRPRRGGRGGGGAQAGQAAGRGR